MIATAWDNVPEQEVAEPVDPTMELVEKLHNERIQLAEKIEKLKMFFTTYTFKNLYWKHRSLLEDQLEAMVKYENVLVERIILLNQPNED